MAAVGNIKKSFLFYLSFITSISQKSKLHRITTQRKFYGNHYDSIQSVKNRIRRRRLYLLLFAVSNMPRERMLWYRTRTDAWFLLAEKCFTDAEWYENFRVSKQSFLFVVGAVEIDIKRQTTVLREAVSPYKRVAITMYYLASTAEYRTIANLIGVSRSFVCICVKRFAKQSCGGYSQSLFIYQNLMS